MALVKRTDNDYYDIVRRNIRKYRLEKKFTQQQLADLSDLSMHFIAEIEQLKRQKAFSIATVGRISDALEIPLSRLFEE